MLLSRGDPMEKNNILCKEFELDFRKIKWDWVFYGLYLILLTILSIFHEPWLDEAEAWQIAKSSSLYDILFLFPHYEGHPPLWHLLLCIPAKLGVPYEIGLKSISLFFSYASGYLLVFKSNIKPYIKYGILFSFFYFYQYGVVSRPYSLMIFALFLALCFFKEKDQKPFRFIFSLLLVCLSSAYGIIISGCVCIAWAIDILGEAHKKKSLKVLAKKRTWALILLLFFAILIILQIKPDSSAYAVGSGDEDGKPLGFLIYVLLSMVADTLAFDIYNYSNTVFEFNVIILSSIVQLAVFLMIVLYSKKGKMKYFFISYYVFALFSYFVYLKAHHIGVAYILLIMWLWINEQDDNNNSIISSVKGKTSNETIRIIGKACKYLFVGALLVIPIFWNIYSSTLDLVYPYCFGRDTAKFLKDTGLYKVNILCEFVDHSQDSDENPYELIQANVCYDAVYLCPYFDGNISMNLNGGDDNKPYVFNKFLTPEENKEALNIVKEKGIPDVIVGSPNLKLIYGDVVSKSDYLPVYEITNHVQSIWKTNFLSKQNGYGTFIYLRKDLIDRYKIKVINEQGSG